MPTPPGKRRVAFRGQYIFVTDDEDSDYDGDASKASTAKSRKSVKSGANKSPSRYSSRSRISEEDEDYYDDYDDDDKKSAASKRTTAKPTAKSNRSRLGESNNHLTPNRNLSSRSTKSNKSSKSSKSGSSNKSGKTTASSSRQSTADSGRNTGSSDEEYSDYSSSHSRQQSTRKSFKYLDVTKVRGEGPY